MNLFSPYEIGITYLSIYDGREFGSYYSNDYKNLRSCV